MSTWLWVVALLTISGYVDSSETNVTTTPDCESALVGFESIARSGDPITRLLPAFPSVAAAFGIPADVLNGTNSPRSPRVAMDEFCFDLNKTALGLAEVVDRCTRPPLTCPPRTVRRAIHDAPFAPSLLLALMDLGASAKAVNYLDTLGRCYGKLRTEKIDYGTVPPAMGQELTGSVENPPIACFISFGRKWMCRYIQLFGVGFLNGRSGNDIAKTCGQEALNLALEFQKDAMLSLRCAEYGDFVRNYDWVRVDYRPDENVHR